jgi:hypothetical protein
MSRRYGGCSPLIAGVRPGSECEREVNPQMPIRSLFFTQEWTAVLEPAALALPGHDVGVRPADERSAQAQEDVLACGVMGRLALGVRRVRPQQVDALGEPPSAPIGPVRRAVGAQEVTRTAARRLGERPVGP